MDIMLSANIQNRDYSSGNFIDTAFGTYEKQAIKETYVKIKIILSGIQMVEIIHMIKYFFFQNQKYIKINMGLSI